MALEPYLELKSLQSKVTVLGNNPIKRELVLGFEDGSVQTFDPETGNLVTDCYKHKGWVTGLASLPEAKVFFSTGNDSTLVTYNAIGFVVDKLYLGAVAYSICFHSRLKQIIFGIPNGVQFHEYELNTINGRIVKNVPLYVICQHEDLVVGVIMLDKLYSVGYDSKLIIYDCPFGDNPYVHKKLNHAHDAGITCLIAKKDTIDNNNEWLMTGSFDKSVKVWSLDGKVIFKFVDFTQPVTGLTYVHSTKTVWIAAGNSYAHVYDPKSGENVSDFIDTCVNMQDTEQRHTYFLVLLRYFPELNVLVASTNLKHCLAWRYNKNGCISCLKVQSPLESVCYTKKIPILMFTGDSEGNVLKWEQTQSNLIIYSSERLLKFEATKAQLMAMVVQATSIGRNKENDEQFNSEQSHLSTSSFQKQNTSNKNSKISERQLPVYHVRNRPTGKMKNREQGVGGYVSQYTHLQKKQSTLNQTAVKSILKTIFVENYDLIIAASEDTNIYVWGYDSEALHALIILRDQLDDTHEGAQVANRVSGFTLRHIFSQHNSLVTSIALIDDVETFGDVFLISAGWDRRICTWNLTHFMLNSIFYNSNATTVEEAEIASPGSILDLAYSPSLKYFAYSTSDQSVYVRKFSTKGYDMDLMYALKSQQDIDITCIRWNYITNQWITGCEDGSIQLWDSAGEFKHTINVRGSVHAITIDYVQKVLLIGAEDTLKVYDMKDYTCLQTNMGHSDIIRDIVFIPERDQYITVSWDKTMRIWNAWSPILLKQQVKIVDPKTQLAQQLWEKLHGFVEQSGVIDDDANTIVEKYFQRQQTFHYNSDEQSRQISSVTK